MNWQQVDFKSSFLSNTVAPVDVQNPHYIVVSDGEILGLSAHEQWQPLSVKTNSAGQCSRSSPRISWV